MNRYLAFAALVPFSVAAQSSDSLRADSAFRARNWRATADAYATISARQPNQGMAWLRLGMARQAMNETDAAIVAFEKALALQFQQPTAHFRLARLQAVKGNSDKAFWHLEQLVPTRAIPVAILDTLSDIAALRGDAHYKKLTDQMTALRFPCRALPEAHQLDFWIGDWDVTPWQAPAASNPAVIGTNRIEPILEHCVLMENWLGGGPSASAGKSMNFWDTNRRQWRQIWMADGGGSLDYAGSLRDGAMRFEGWTLAPNGNRILQKLTFFPISQDTVRQLFETSSDSGKTWQPGFDGRYVRSGRARERHARCVLSPPEASRGTRGRTQRFERQPVSGHGRRTQRAAFGRSNRDEAGGARRGCERERHAHQCVQRTPRPAQTWRGAPRLGRRAFRRLIRAIRERDSSRQRARPARA